MADTGRRRFEEVDDLGQILFCDDPALRLDGLLMTVDTAQGAFILDPAQTPHMPAALFDFRVAIGAGGAFPYAATRTAPVDDELKDPRIGGAIRCGMMLLPPEFGELRLPQRWSGDDRVVIALKRMMSGGADLRSIPGWELHATADDPPAAWARMNCAYSRLELRTPDGGLYSRTWVPYDPDWRAAALDHGYVVCLCGVELGIRAPYAMTDAQYTPPMRHENFRRACVAGLALGGLVPYTDHH
ncbi:hypothetical protein [Actinacidiphila acidipaludis]|uniref:Uncharacterized protein n=1 Tax=Actinacidiphila acidipaludis TaxID=2873382 RepID=A0ABS7QHE2_9ACTN|nr:hypothetical protein [Streptomyces acidipaludis]MBY8882582.1 hypothetical protein [Streptomyces acidipaludis]